MPIPFKLDYIIEKVTQPQLTDTQRTLNRLAGVNLSAPEAQALLPRIRDHKWYVSERLGRDVGWRVAVIDYFENIHEPHATASSRKKQDTIPPLLPMMQSLSARLSS